MSVTLQLCQVSEWTDCGDVTDRTFTATGRTQHRGRCGEWTLFKSNWGWSAFMNDFTLIYLFRCLSHYMIYSHWANFYVTPNLPETSTDRIYSLFFSLLYIYIYIFFLYFLTLLLVEPVFPRDWSVCPEHFHSCTTGCSMSRPALSRLYPVFTSCFFFFYYYLLSFRFLWLFCYRVFTSV